MPPADLSRIYFGYLLLIVQLFIKLKGKIGQRLTSRAPGYARSFSCGRGAADGGQLGQAAGLSPGRLLRRSKRESPGVGDAEAQRPLGDGIIFCHALRDGPSPPLQRVLLRELRGP
jgi:hypothetical protein